jgi:hypothetical protein
MHGVTQAMPVHLFFVAQLMIAPHSIALIASLAPSHAISSSRQPPIASGVHEQFSHGTFIWLAIAVHCAFGLLAAVVEVPAAPVVPAPEAVEPPLPLLLVAVLPALAAEVLPPVLVFESELLLLLQELTATAIAKNE